MISGGGTWWRRDSDDSKISVSTSLSREAGEGSERSLANMSS